MELLPQIPTSELICMEKDPSFPASLQIFVRAAGIRRKLVLFPTSEAQEDARPKNMREMKPVPGVQFIHL